MIDRIDRLQLDLDLRLREIWEFAFDIQFDRGRDRFTVDDVGVLMRAAYGRGYMDALEEPVEASLCRDHGYRMPKRARLG